MKMNTRDTLNHVVDIVKENEDHIDLILATGDIAQDASVAAYEIFSDSVKPLAAPIRWIPGNHDSASIMLDAAAGTDNSEKLVRMNNWLIVMLDTSIEGQVHGELAPEELEFLESSLQEAEAVAEVEHVLVCLHHNPVPGSAGWMKDIGLLNGDEFFKIVTRFEKVRSILYGHIHQELDFLHDGVRCLCSPSTCIQFKPEVQDFALDVLNPGYRSLKLFEDGNIETEVHRVEGSTLEADYNSSGY